MIHEIGVELGAALAAVSCPIKVVDGPEPTNTTTFARERIVIEHDEQTPERFTSKRVDIKNPKQRFVRHVTAKLTLYAQSPKPGATQWEHRRRVEHLLDLVLVQLEAVIYARKNAWTITGGKLVQPADLAASETIGGAVYELPFSVERGVNAQNWDSSIAGEVAIDDETIVTTATATNNQGGGPETA